MYDELFDDVLFEEYLNDTDILNEDAGGARGKYIQVQKEKIKKLKEKKKSLEVLITHATGDKKNNYRKQLRQLDDDIYEAQSNINTYDDPPHRQTHDPYDDSPSIHAKHKNAFKYYYHDDSDGGDSVHGNINHRAENK